MPILIAYKKALTHYFNFKGRTSLKDFAWFFWPLMIVMILLPTLGLEFNLDNNQITTVLTIYLAIFIIPFLSSATRRLRDVGLCGAGWWIMLLFIPIIGFAILIILLHFPTHHGKRSISLFTYYVKAWRYLFCYSGRSKRVDFWSFILITFLVFAIILICSYLFETSTILYELFLNIFAWYAIISIIPFVAISTRRLHDVNCTGWLQICWVVPIFAVFILGILFSKPSVPYDNRFGPFIDDDEDNLNEEDNNDDDSSHRTIESIFDLK